MQPKNEKETRGKREVERRCVPLPTSAVPTRGRHLKEMDHMQRKGEKPRGTKDKGDDRQAPNLNNTRNKESREEKAPKGKGGKAQMGNLIREKQRYVPHDAWGTYVHDSQGVTHKLNSQETGRNKKALEGRRETAITKEPTRRMANTKDNGTYPTGASSKDTAEGYAHAWSKRKPQEPHTNVLTQKRRQGRKPRRAEGKLLR